MVGTFSITDEKSIAAAVKATSDFQHGWQTELQMALTTGWFTYPTPQDTVGFRDKNGKTLLVLWFGPGWMGSRAFDNGASERYFRRVSDKEVAKLRTALRMTGSAKASTPSTAELQR